MENQKNTSCKRKVLIINPYPIDADCPIGIMMGNLFSEFDSENILQYYNQECHIQSTSKFNSKKINLTLPIINNIKRFIKSTLQRRQALVIRDSDMKLRNTGSSSNPWKLWFDLIMPSFLEKEMLNEIYKFKPDVIYTQVYSYRMLKLVIKISKLYSCPIVVHTLDDWMGSNYKKDIISHIPTIYFDNKIRNILNNGQNHMVASPKMKDYMENKYGGKYSFVMNSSKYEKIDAERKNRNTLKVVYTGGLMLERFLVLDEIAGVINSINKNGIKFEMHVYAPNSHIESYRNRMQDSIIFHDNINHQDVFKILKDADILIHSESFNPNVLNFTRYSLSTKIPEYLSSSRPLIYYGPQNIGVAEFLTSEKIGISTDSLKDLEKHLINIYEDKIFYRNIGEEGYIKGKKLLEKTIMQERLFECLQN